MHFSLVTEHSVRTPSVKCFDDVIFSIYYALENLGFAVEILYGKTNPDTTNIIFGGNIKEYVSKLDLPKNSILFNLEQYTKNSPWFTRDYIKLLSSFPVWDYSLRNCQSLNQNFGINPTHVRLGFADAMVQIPENPAPRKDLLFYGSLNSRRKPIIDSILANGIDLKVAHNIFGSIRDYHLFDCKLVLNIHHYEPPILELPRLGYLFANRKPVISEITDQTELYPEHDGTCFFFRKDQLADRIPAVVSNPRAYRAKAEAAFKIFSNVTQEDILQKIVGKRCFTSPATRPMPRCLNIGSGKNYMWHALNIDIQEQCNPDLVYDLSAKKLTSPEELVTDRFGSITLHEGCFSHIIAHDILEHVPRLDIMMWNMLHLLEAGGELEINVPYDLSLGAWQDPTHVRSFN